MKRSLTIAVIAVLAVGLVVGSVYVVLRPEEEHRQAGQTSSELLAQSGGTDDGSGRIPAIGELSAEPVSVGEDRGGGVRGFQGQNAWYAGEDLEWITLEGQVTASLGREFVLSAAGNVIKCGTGPEWYWEESGYQVNVGDELRVTGCEHDDEFSVRQIENPSTGEVITLRDEQGRPGWAGRGWRQQS